MKHSLARGSTLLLILLASCAAQPPSAQAPAPQPSVTISVEDSPAPAAPPATTEQPTAQSQPAAMTSSQPAPQPDKITSTPAAEIPLRGLKLPPGFKIEVWSDGVAGVRELSRGASGKVYASSSAGRVYEITDHGKKRTSRVIADKLSQPSLAMHKGRLYVMTADAMLRFDGVEKTPKVTPIDMSAAFKRPAQPDHSWKRLRFGPDGKLYAAFDVACNNCEPVVNESAEIRRYNADGSGMETLAAGLRSAQDFDWSPFTRELWFINSSRTTPGDNTPEDALFRLSRKTQGVGLPDCPPNAAPRPRENSEKKQLACKNAPSLVALMGARAAATGMQFYTGKMFPAPYHKALFVARQDAGSGAAKNVRDVVVVHASAGAKSAKVTPFLSGFADPGANTFWGRPAHLLQLPDGSMLLSDEQTGAIYRISYSRPHSDLNSSLSNNPNSRSSSSAATSKKTPKTPKTAKTKKKAVK